MAQELTLKTNHTPSLLNKDLLLGGLLAALVPVGGLVSAAVIVGGALLGGFIGKKTQEKENAEGKKVGEPSFWNKDTVIGGVIGLLGAKLVFALTALATVGATAVAAGTAPVAAPVVAGLGLLAMVGALVATPIIGAYVGNKIGQKRQAAELEQAKHQTIVEHLSSTVSPEVGKAVEYTMTHNKSWAKDVTEAKMLADAQQGIRQP